MPMSPISHMSSMSDLEIPTLVQARKSITEAAQWCNTAYTVDSTDIATTQYYLKLAEESIFQFQVNELSFNDVQIQNAIGVLQLCKLRAARHSFSLDKNEDQFADKLANIILSRAHNLSLINTQIKNEVLPEYSYVKYSEYLTNNGGVLGFQKDRFLQIAKKVDIDDQNIRGLPDFDSVRYLSQQNIKLIEAAKLLELPLFEIRHLIMMIFNINYLNQKIQQYIQDYSPSQSFVWWVADSLLRSSPTIVPALVMPSPVISSMTTPSCIRSAISLRDLGELSVEALATETCPPIGLSKVRP